MRLNVTVPDHLIEQARKDRPDLNVSGVLQEALRRLLECPHDRAVCGDCGEPVDSNGFASLALEAFYRELLRAWEPLVDRGGTAVGAAQVAKAVAVGLGVPGADWRPLPRQPRAMRRTG